MIGGLSQVSLIIFALLGVLTAFLWTELRDVQTELGQKQAEVLSLSASNSALQHENERQRVLTEKVAKEKREAQQKAAALKIKMAEAIKDDECAASVAPLGVVERLRSGSD